MDPKYGAVLPPGYRLDWSGEFAQMEKANARLMWIVPISIGLIMILLYTAFNSLKDALLVMVNVVAATMGGVWALLITRSRSRRPWGSSRSLVSPFRTGSS